MARNPDILSLTEYIKNILYFAIAKPGKEIFDTRETHYFCTDHELIYENYYCDFGPLNLGCVYKYCNLVNDKLKQYVNKMTIVHYTSSDPKKKANAAYLLGCYGVLYLGLLPEDAIRPLLALGQSYRPFQDAVQGDSMYTITILECLLAIKKAHCLGFFNFHDFNCDAYDKFNKVREGDLNWIVPGKFLAFMGPTAIDYSKHSFYHPPETYIDYFLENNVRLVIRLNKRLYDESKFTNYGILHLDLVFPDGSCPPRHILFKFMQISEEFDGAIGVHCKAGLGRTGSLIGCYLIKHYRMTAHEAIAWMRICRPGSVIGHQQHWLEQLEPWLFKQGDVYRKRKYHDADRLPVHEFGIYSFPRRSKQSSIMRSPSRSPSPHKKIAPSVSMTPRPRNSRIRENKSENEDEEVFLTSCDLTQESSGSTGRGEARVLNVQPEPEELTIRRHGNVTVWKKILCCQLCLDMCFDSLWMFAVQCTNITPKPCHTMPHKMEQGQCEWRVTNKCNTNNGQKTIDTGEMVTSRTKTVVRTSSGAGEPPPPRSKSRVSSAQDKVKTTDSNFTQSLQHSTSPKRNHTGVNNNPNYSRYHTSKSSVKTVNDAKKLGSSNSISRQHPKNELSSVIKVTHASNTPTPHTLMHYPLKTELPGKINSVVPSSYSSASRGPSQPHNRHRLGRSPSPPQTRPTGQTRGTNTVPTTERLITRELSKINIKEALSKLKVAVPRERSLGAASLGARQQKQTELPTSSVRSDERHRATQGDMLNSVKFQRRLRETLITDFKTNTNKTEVEGCTSRQSQNSAYSQSLNRTAAISKTSRADYSYHGTGYASSQDRPSYSRIPTKYIPIPTQPVQENLKLIQSRPHIEQYINSKNMTKVFPRSIDSHSHKQDSRSYQMDRALPPRPKSPSPNRPASPKGRTRPNPEALNRYF